MCDYCGCRRQAPIDDLSAEHDRVLDLGYRLRRLARDDDHAGVAEVLEHQFGPLLQVHTAKEERGVFAALRDSWEADDRLDALVDEHRELEAGITTVVDGASGWQDVLLALLDDLSEHILAEETDLFPYALYELGAGQWEAVAATHVDVDATRSVV